MKVLQIIPDRYQTVPVDTLLVAEQSPLYTISHPVPHDIDIDRNEEHETLENEGEPEFDNNLRLYLIPRLLRLPIFFQSLNRLAGRNQTR